MKQSKFMDIFLHLRPAYQKQFVAFLGFRAIPSHRKYIPLVETLSKGTKTGEEPKEEWAGLIWKNEAYSPSRLYTALSELFDYLEEFLALQQIRQHTMLREQLALGTIESDGPEEILPKQLRALQREISHQPYRHDEYHWHCMKAAEAGDAAFMKKQVRLYDPHLQEKSDALDRYYFTRKLKTACEIINRNNIIGRKYDTGFLHPLIQHLDTDTDLKEVPSVKIYLSIYRMLEYQQETDFEALKHLLEQYTTLFPREEARDLYDYALNFCIKKINVGQSAFVEKAFHLYRNMLDSGVAFRGPYLTQWDFKNLVTLGNRLKKYDWVEKFLHEHKVHLEPEFRENAFNFNLANVYYEQGESRKALRILNSVEFTDIFYGLSARSLLLKLYFESGDEEAFYNLADAFGAWIKRNEKISVYQKNIHRNLIRFTKKAMDLRLSSLPGDKVQSESARWIYKLDNGTEVANSEWIRTIFTDILQKT